VIALVLIRGIVNASPTVKKIVRQHKIRKNHAVYFEDTPENRALARMLKDYATWGITDKKTKANQPAKGGYGSIKLSYKQGGGLGERGEDMQGLLKRMTW